MLKLANSAYCHTAHSAVHSHQIEARREVVAVGADHACAGGVDNAVGAVDEYLAGFGQLYNQLAVEAVGIPAVVAVGVFDRSGATVGGGSEVIKVPRKSRYQRLP